MNQLSLANYKPAHDVNIQSPNCHIRNFGQNVKFSFDLYNLEIESDLFIGDIRLYVMACFPQILMDYPSFYFPIKN